MEKLMKDIVTYLEYLEQSLGLGVSVHFSYQTLNEFPEDMFAMLLPYNVHKNPYCAMVKKQHWDWCISVQQKILHEKKEYQGMCHICYAGVQEWIYQIWNRELLAGYVAVSGYRESTPPENCTDIQMWEDCLANTKPSAVLLDAVIPPLVRMFELFLRYPHQREYQGEYNLILQYLHERHGQVTLQELCEHFGRSKSYISHMFNDKCQSSLPVYCNSLKLDYARTLLARLHIPITEIALDVGYNDVSYFILRFKEKYGITPLQYRKSLIDDERQENARYYRKEGS